MERTGRIISSGVVVVADWIRTRYSWLESQSANFLLVTVVTGGEIDSYSLYCREYIKYQGMR